MTSTEHHNSQCPDYMSHAQNAEDTLYPNHGQIALTAEQSAAVDAMADAEYRECEGH